MRLSKEWVASCFPLKLTNLNPRLWLNWRRQACAEAGGKAPPNIDEFLTWNLSDDQRAALVNQGTPTPRPDTS